MRISFLRRWSVVLLLLVPLFGPVAPGHIPAVRAAPLSNGQVASTVLGQQTFDTNSNAAPTILNGPAGVAVDPSSGKVFVADSANNRVLRFAALSSLTNGAAAEAVLGQPDLFSTVPATTAWGMKQPAGLATDNVGRLWVADRQNNRVLRFDNAATKSSGAAADAVLGQPDFTTGTRVWEDPDLKHIQGPIGIATDAVGRLWVAESGANRILRFDNAAAKPNGASADGSIRDLFGPTDVKVDSGGRLWVADQYTIMRYDAPETKPRDAPFDGIFTVDVYSLALDTNGNLWAASGDLGCDCTRSEIRRFDNAANKPDNAPPDGQFAVSGKGMTSDGSGRLWVADTTNNRVLRFDNPAGKADNAPADSVLGHQTISMVRSTVPALVRQPHDVAVDPSSGKVFVSDSGNNRVLRFASLASLASGAAAEGVLGQPDLNTIEQTWPASTARMNNPAGLTIDTSGRLWVADRGNFRVLRFDNAATKPNGAPADGTFGKALDRPPMSDMPFYPPNPTATLLYLPSDVAVDSDGRLWVADSGYHRVLRFDNAAAKPDGAPADAVLGQLDFTTDTAATGAQGMNAANGVAVDAAGRLWVADQKNNRVLRFDNAAGKSNGATADGVLGQATFTSVTVVALAQGMWEPSGVAVDASGRLWVADMNNNRVLGFDTAAFRPNGSPANVVLGQADFGGSRPATTWQGMRSPRGVTLDGAGNLWVSDSGNNRVLLFDPDAPPPPPAAYPPALSTTSSSATLPACSAAPCPPVEFRWTLETPLLVNATVTITLPAGLELVGSVYGASPSGNTLRFSGAIPSDKPLTIRYQARAQPAPDQLLTAIASVEIPGMPTVQQNLTVLALPPEQPDALVMIYASGDNDLADAMQRMAISAERASSERVATLLMLDGPGTDDAYLYKLQPPAPGQPDCFIRLRDPSCGGRYRFGEHVQKWPDNVANSAALTDFLLASQRAFPAKRQVLSLVGHGGGWSPNVLGGQPSRHGGQSLAGMLWDDQPRSSLSTADLARALRDGQRQFGSPLDLLYLDACSMGQIEVAYELRNSARFLLASPNWKWSALPYDQHLPDATAGNGRQIGEAWIANEEQALEGYPYTYTLLDLGQVETLRTSVNLLASALMSQSSEVIKTAFQRADRYDDDQNGVLDAGDNVVDLGSFVEQIPSAQGLRTFSAAGGLEDAATQVRQALQRSVVKRSAQAGEPWPFPGQRWSWEGSSGLAIYLPLRETDDWRRRYYRTLAFGQGSTWASLIDQAWSGAQPPAEPVCPAGCVPPSGELPLPGQRSVVSEVHLPLIRR